MNRSCNPHLSYPFHQRRMAHDGDGIRVLDDSRELRSGMRHGQGKGDSTRSPDAPLDGNVFEAGRYQEGNPSFGQVFSRAQGQEPTSYPLRGIEKVSVAEKTLGSHERDAVLVTGRAGEEIGATRISPESVGRRLGGRVDRQGPTRASTLRGLPLPSTILRGAAMITEPVAGSWSKLHRLANPNFPAPCMIV